MLVAVALMLADHHTRWLVPVRSALQTITAPLFIIAEIPYEATETFVDWLNVGLDNERLREENLELQGRLQRTLALEDENARLRELLGGSARLGSRYQFAELVGVVPNPQSREVIVGVGDAEGAFPGQAVVSADGLVGQVLETGLGTSRVLLITDVSHATPVEVVRNGLRFIAQGTGEDDRLVLQFVPATADVREGDTLVTSGLGLRFPSGYPVAVIERVLQEPTEPFALVDARPVARVEQSRHLLLVRGPGDAASAAPDPEAAVDAGEEP